MLNPQDLDQMDRPIQVHLLQNGGQDKLKNETYVYTKTCALDSMLHVLSVLYADIDSLRTYISNNSDNPVFEMVCSMAVSAGKTKQQIMKKRNELIKLMYTKSKKSNDRLVFYECASNIGFITDKIHHKSLAVTNSCTCPSESNFTYLPVNIEKLQQVGLKYLQKCVELDFEKCFCME